MRLADISDYFVLRRYLIDPWSFLRLRKHSPTAPFYDLRFQDGGNFRLRTFTSDRRVFKEVFARDEYRLNGFGSGSLGTVIDIGAHIGTFAVRLAPLAHRIICYEPACESYELLVCNVNRFPHVKPHRSAVSGRRETTTLFVASSADCNSIFPVEGVRYSERVPVETITLADIFVEHSIERCDLLKIDCEGAEYDILYALPVELGQRIERICLEYHPVVTRDRTWSGEKLAEHLACFGHKAELYPSRKNPRQGLIFSYKC